MKEESKSKPTIDDVAKYCGVSVATVSRVINKSGQVSKDLNVKVRKAIKELGFVPRQSSGRTATETIAMVIPNLLNPFFAEIIQGAQEEADRLDLNLLVMNLTEHPKCQEKQLNLLRTAMFDGLIMMASRLQPEVLIELHEAYHIPIVGGIRLMETSRFPCVLVDYKTAAYQAAKYLFSLHHTRIAYISGPPEWVSSKSRMEGIEQAYSENDLSISPASYRWCDPSIQDGYQVVGNLLTLPPQKRPTGIVAFNDLIAIGALHAIRTSGLSVPDDISVIGFDDIAMAAHTNPPLTTISQPKYQIGQLSVKKLYDLMQGNPASNGDFLFLECPLIVRESTAPYVKQ